MKDKQTNSITRLTSFTVKQLSELFGKSEDTIRRWKNEGVGKGEDNIKLRAVENEDEFGHRTSRHLVFTRSAVRDFVQANPFLMDDAPQLREFMERREKRPDVFALPGSVEDSRRRTAWQDAEEYEEDVDEDGEPDIFGSFFDEVEEEYEASEDDFLNRFLRSIRGNGKRRARPRPEPEFFDEDEDEEPEPEEDFTSRRRGRRGPDAEDEDFRRWQESAKNVGSMNYMLLLIHEREKSCRQELARNEQALELFELKLGGKLPDDGIYIKRLLDEKQQELEQELRSLSQTRMALHELHFKGEI